MLTAEDKNIAQIADSRFSLKGVAYFPVFEPPSVWSTDELNVTLIMSFYLFSDTMESRKRKRPARDNDELYSSEYEESKRCN